MTKDHLIMVLLFICGLQAGYILSEFLNWKYGSVPMITPSEIVEIMKK